uniref:Uncharacterized protein n=1 Tax=Anguilla anguilla TaxID=7936 RepID=A0A0E9UIW1_ANGAN
MCKNCSFVYLTTFMSHCKVWKTRLGIQQLLAHFLASCYLEW